mmetsp:Transcript_20415/g.43147  ORF Transcript_20415/g.43147 Transcript_20415/m.43147 type:complete len:298 (-) Transcript_20415:783-1676(-)
MTRVVRQGLLRKCRSRRRTQHTNPALSQRVGAAWADLTQDTSKQRFFSLFEGGRLEYFRVDRHINSRPRGLLDCRGCRVSLDEDLCTLTVYTAERDLVLRASTSQEARDWAEAIAQEGEGINELETVNAAFFAEQGRSTAAERAAAAALEAAKAQREVDAIRLRASRAESAHQQGSAGQALILVGNTIAGACVFIAFKDERTHLLSLLAVAVFALLIIQSLWMSRPAPPAPAPAEPRWMPLQEENMEDNCVVCLDAAKTHLLVPCGHQCVCSCCARALSSCPICRAFLTGSAIKVYK